MECYQAGATVYELAHQFNINRRTVSLRLKQAGVTLRGQSPTPDEINEMIQLYQSGLSLAGVAGRTGFVARTVQRYLHEADVQTRDTHGRGRA